MQSFPYYRGKLDAYNVMCLTQLRQIILDVSPIICWVPQGKKWDVIYITEVVINKPVKMDSEQPLAMRPQEAMDRGLSMVAQVMGTLLHREYVATSDFKTIPGIESMEVVKQHGKLVAEREQRGVELFQFPVLVKSILCHLSDRIDPLCGNKDPGGYFVLGRSQKMINNRERKAYNKIFVEAVRKPGPFTHMAQIRSQHPNRIRSSSTLNTFLGKSRRLNADALFFEFPHIKNKRIPWILGVRALGGVDDDYLRALFRVAAHWRWSKEASDILEHSLQHDGGVKTQQAAVISITKRRNDQMEETKAKRGRKRSESVPNQGEQEHQRLVAMRGCLRDLQKEFLPRLGQDSDEVCSRRKIAFLCFKAAYLVHHVQLERVVGPRAMTNPDSYVNKRIQTILELVSDLMRQLWHLEITTIKNTITKAAAKAYEKKKPKPIIDLERLFKANITTLGLQKSIKNGIWHVKQPKQGAAHTGVSGPLERLCPLATMSHYGKLIRNNHSRARDTKSRGLENSAFCTVDPADTPDGNKSGLINHSTLFNLISTDTSALGVTTLLEIWGAHQLGILTTHQLQQLTAWQESGADYVLVSVNNHLWVFPPKPLRPTDPVVCADAETILERLREARTQLRISPCTGINPEYAYDISYKPDESDDPHPALVNEIVVRTDGGRCLRPVITKEGIEAMKELGPDMVLVPWPQLLKEGFVEYIDKEEETTRLISFL